MFRLRFGVGAMPGAQDIADGLTGKGVSEVRERTDDSILTPVGILAGTADYDVCDFGIHRTAWKPGYLTRQTSATIFAGRHSAGWATGAQLTKLPHTEVSNAYRSLRA